MGRQARVRAERRAQTLNNTNRAVSLARLWPIIAEPVIYKHFRPDCCLNATRVLIDVFQTFGVEVKAVPALVTVYNPKMVQLMRGKGGTPDTKEQMDAWVEQGAWAVAVSGEPVDGQDGWPFHLVGLTGNILIDPSAKQMRRPQRNILVPGTIVLRVNDEWATGTRPHVAMAEMNGEQQGAVVYQARPDVTSHTKETGFSRHQGNRDVAREIIQLMDYEIKRLAREANEGRAAADPEIAPNIVQAASDAAGDNAGE